MPQSVYFSNSSILDEFSRELKKYSNVTIVCRCNESLNIMKRARGPNTNLVLAPDMAFMIGDVEPVEEATYDVIFLSREGEKRPEYKAAGNFLKSLRSRNISVLAVDWSAWSSNLRKGERIPSPSVSQKLPEFRLEMAKRILSKGKIVLSDRMHAIILGMLMGKPVVALDNIYDKFGRVYDTFLSNYTNSELKLERVSSFEEAERAIANFISAEIFF